MQASYLSICMLLRGGIKSFGLQCVSRGKSNFACEPFESSKICFSGDEPGGSEGKDALPRPLLM
eukprot:6173567-Pleurochrysis_carterae.AAC.2